MGTSSSSNGVTALDDDDAAVEEESAETKPEELSKSSSASSLTLRTLSAGLTGALASWERGVVTSKVGSVAEVTPSSWQRTSLLLPLLLWVVVEGGLKVSTLKAAKLCK